MKEYTHYGVYGLIIKDNKIVLINKVTGPYDGKLDLPGGSIEFGEKPEETLKRELKEELGIEVLSYNIINADSITFKWNYKDNLFNWQHLGIFYEIKEYKNKIKKEIIIDKHNDDSKGANFYNINELKKDDLSQIAILILEKLGYNLK
ncbi:MAG: NUDIX domain-containing protein [Bacilli bacterium]|nr:NUDIX domain-containing protein [Bacilli bacterium]